MRRSYHNPSRRSAETRLGLPRPSLESMRTTSSSSKGHYSEAENTDYEDEDEYYDEEEAEALLSRKHGEAAEASDNKTKKRSSDQDVADEYAQQEKERKKKARRRTIRTILPDDLLKPLGLTVVRNGIATKFQSAKYNNNTKSMAKFSRRLISSYADWMDHLSGGLSLHEAQWKLKTMGSKTQIKQYLQDMRKSVRNDHVERLLGLEKAQCFLGQLEDYYNEEHLHEAGEDEENYDRGSSENSSSTTIANPYAQTANNDNEDTGNAAAVATRASSAAVTPTNAKPTDQQQEQAPDQDDPLVRRLALQKEQRVARKHVLEDSDDDEEEALFDDVVPAASQKSGSSSNTKAARRHVLDDDSDDEDETDEKDNGNNEDSNPEKSVENVQTHSAKDEMSEGASFTGQDDDSDEDSTHKDSEEASTSNTIHKLDKKFQNVKALLEGGNPKETDAPLEQEDTKDSAETAMVEGETEEDGEKEEEQ